MFNSKDYTVSPLVRLGKSTTDDLSLIAATFSSTPRFGPQPSGGLDVEMSQPISTSASQDGSAVCLWRSCRDSHYAIATTKEKVFEHVYSAHIQRILGGEFYCKWEGCSDMEFGYGNPNALRHHMLEKHVQLNFSICFHPECDGRFTSTADRMKHLREVHSYPKHAEYWDVAKQSRLKESARSNLGDSVKTTPRSKSSRLYPDLFSREEARENYIDRPIFPPYTAHLANLSFDTTEADIRKFFKDLHITEVLIDLDSQLRNSEHSAYVDFVTQYDLRVLLSDTYDTCRVKGNELIISVVKPCKLSRCFYRSCSELC